jgi:hypothetical protein
MTKMTEGRGKVALLFRALVMAAVLMQFGTAEIAASVKRGAPRAERPGATRMLTARATNYSIDLRQPASHLYAPGENVEVSITTNASGGGIENDIGLQSQTIPQGTSNVVLGRVPAPGVYFTRYKVGSETFVNSFLVLPAGNNRFTVEIVSAPVTAVNLNAAGNAAAEKFFRNLTLTRLRAAAAAVAPAWFAQNGQNFLVLVAKGIVLTYSGLGFIAVVGQQGLARDLFALSLDFMATALSRAADDLRTAGVLSTQERDAVKLAITGINGLTQTLLSEGVFQRVVSVGQAAAEAVLGQDSDSQVAAKLAGDSAKKFHVFIQLHKLTP